MRIALALAASMVVALGCDSESNPSTPDACPDADSTAAGGDATSTGDGDASAPPAMRRDLGQQKTSRVVHERHASDRGAP